MPEGNRLRGKPNRLCRKAANCAGSQTGCAGSNRLCGKPNEPGGKRLCRRPNQLCRRQAAVQKATDCAGKQSAMPEDAVYAYGTQRKGEIQNGDFEM